jgi:hypothetical protein
VRYRLQAPIKFSMARRGYYYCEDTYRLPFLQLDEGVLISRVRSGNAVDYAASPQALRSNWGGNAIALQSLVPQRGIPETRLR